MSPEILLMQYLESITGIPLKPYVERDSVSGHVIVGNKPYAIMGDVRINHRQTIGGDNVSGGFVISGFFPKDKGMDAENWGEFMRRKLLGSTVELGEYSFTFNSVRKQVRKDISTQSILHRTTITVVFERSNEILN